MDIAAAVQVAVHKMQLDAMKTLGTQVAATLASAPSPRGSVNAPGQGI
jgi:hypothetical protein